MVNATSTDFSWYRRAQDCIAQGALTNSKRPECFVLGAYPTHLKRGEGCHVYDTTGKRYIDYITGLGSNLFGYGNSYIHESVANAFKTGSALSLSSDLEIYFAEKVKEFFPWITHIKILKTGTESTLAALRIARAYTGRNLILSEGYHGWSDEFTSLNPPALGVPGTYTIEKLHKESRLDKAAAVIVEPVMTDDGPERIAWLRDLRRRCNASGALLIFDEVITGLRYLGHGVSNCHGIEPDLICLGKAIGGGMPLAVVGGKTHIMNCGEYFVSSTFAGERVSLAAGLKALELLQTNHKYSINDLWREGTKFLLGFNRMWPEMIRIEGYATRGTFKGSDTAKALLWQEACKAGILFGSSWFFNFSHPEQTEIVLNTLSDIMVRIKHGNVKLEGTLPTSPFAAKVRG